MPQQSLILTFCNVLCQLFLCDWYPWHQMGVFCRSRVLDYYTQRVSLVHSMEQQIDFIGQTSEFARVYGIEFCDVVAKGSQYKVESMMLRIAKPLNFVAVSPNIQQRVRMNPPGWLLAFCSFILCNSHSMSC